MADTEISSVELKTLDPPSLEPEFDIGNLLAIDICPIEVKDFTQSPNHYLKELALRSVQLLVNKIWELPSERYEEAIIVKLPKCTTRLPREKPVPKQKAATKWEQYAKDKGIHKNKKETLVWDEAVKDWRPRYGFRRVNHDSNDWLVEVPEKADLNTDVFKKKADDKKERVAKNEFQRLRNIARAQKLKMPSNSLVQGGGKPSKQQMSQAIVNAKRSTASIGKFNESLADKKQPKQLGKKRRFESNFGDLNTEKLNSLKILENLGKKTPKMDVTQAVNYQNHKEEMKQKENNHKLGRNKKMKTRTKDGKNKSKSFIKKKQQRQQKPPRPQKRH